MVYSLNVPVPGAVKRLAADLAPALAAFETVRERHTLVLKRLGGDPSSFDHLQQRARRALSGAPAVEARVTGIDSFIDPVSGNAPVVYLAIDSSGLVDLHERLLEVFDPVEELEGSAWVPHVTLARGGSNEAAEVLVERSIEPVTWTVGHLQFYDARSRERVGTVSLPKP